MAYQTTTIQHVHIEPWLFDRVKKYIHAHMQTGCVCSWWALSTFGYLIGVPMVSPIVLPLFDRWPIAHLEADMLLFVCFPPIE